jgi:hypothetical protein
MGVLTPKSKRTLLDKPSIERNDKYTKTQDPIYIQTNSLFYIIIKVFLFDHRTIFLPYLTLGLNHVHNMTLPHILTSNGIKMHIKGCPYPRCNM